MTFVKSDTLTLTLTLTLVLELVKDGVDVVPTNVADGVVEGRDLFDGVDGGAIGGGRVGLVRSERLGDSLSKRSKKALLEFAQVKRLFKKCLGFGI